MLGKDVSVEVGSVTQSSFRKFVIPQAVDLPHHPD